MKLDYGVGFHCHHDRLIEIIEGLQTRCQVIRQDKPAEEQSERLRLILIIPDEELPLGMQPLVAAARDVWVKVQALVQALDDEYRAKRQPLDVEYRVKGRAPDARYWRKSSSLYAGYWAQHRVVNAEYLAKYKLLAAALMVHAEEMKVLHARLCPSCPWVGKTIFPGEGV